MTRRARLASSSAAHARDAFMNDAIEQHITSAICMNTFHFMSLIS